jgi:hypothetical protein
VSNEIYHFEPAEDNEAGFSLNKREVAVYKLAGFIHKTYRNAGPGEAPGQPIWSYVERGGKLSGIESTESIEALQAELSDAPYPQPKDVPNTQTLGSVQRLFIGLETDDGSTVNRDAVIEMLASKLDTFTVADVLGYYQGTPEPTLIVEVAKTGGAKLEPLARDLADAFDQDAVGLEKGGIYTRVFGEKKRTHAQLAEDDRKKLNQFTGALSKGEKFNELDAELQAWWLNRY